MHKNGITSIQYTETDAATHDSYGGQDGGTHTHDVGSLSVCMFLTYRTTDMHTHLSTLVWCLQKPLISVYPRKKMYLVVSPLKAMK